jgi:P-type Ca2+ transporter type 2C
MTPRGLTSQEAAARLALNGLNEVSRVRKPLHRRIRDSLSQPLVLLLVPVAVIYAALGQVRDAIVIFAVIFTVSWVEIVIRWRANHAISTLNRLSASHALVWRDGELIEVPPERLVRDDMIFLSTGSRVPADARLVDAEKVLVDESLVTGESQPVEYGMGPGLNRNVSAGTRVVRGRGIAIVTAIGKDSAMGRVASLVDQAQLQVTPLQRQMGTLSRVLVGIALAASVVVAGIGLVRGLGFQDMLLSGLTLAFATVPAELPVLVIVVLGLGSLRLARRGAIVRNLQAAETLGAVTLICTDKTGTLTSNRIALTEVVTAGEVLEGPRGGGDKEYLKRVARLACDPPAGDDPRATDPIDLAIWRSSSADWPDPSIRFGFDESRRLASGLTEVDGRLLLGVKGAAEAVIVRSQAWRSIRGVEPLGQDLKSRVVAVAAELAQSGGRVLAVASRVIENPVGGGGPTWLERELVFEGLLLCSDTLRPEVPGAIRDLFRAGVHVCMVTGDQPATAEAVARSAGLGGSVFIAAQTKSWSAKDLATRATLGAVFARARPEDKLRIVEAAGSAGEVVGATGDGVNDAPALEAAALGVAMGGSGSDVAREAADLVLAGDNFATLATAVAEGRRLYENVRKAIKYYLTVKLALIAISLAVAITGHPLPFAPVQILGIELFLDVGASIAFINQPPEADEMRRRPRPLHMKPFDGGMLSGIIAGGLTLALIGGGVYVYALSMPSLGVPGARTLALACWLIAQASLGVVMAWERRGSSLVRLFENKAMVIWALAAIVFAAIVLFIPPVQALLHAGSVPLQTAAIAAAASLILPWWLELVKRAGYRFRPEP